jgi:hypothetical protein
MIQLIEKQNGNYRLLINEVECLFKPMELFINKFMPVKKCCVNGSLGWYVGRKFISYNKIKKSLNK